jgi:ABC-2 type transport system ATP-binding protein
LRASLGTEVVRLQFADVPTYGRALTILGADPSADRLRTIDVPTDGSAADVLTTLARLQEAGAPALKVSTHRPSLDEVFLSLTGADHAPPAHFESAEVA